MALTPAKTNGVVHTPPNSQQRVTHDQFMADARANYEYLSQQESLRQTFIEGVFSQLEHLTNENTELVNERKANEDYLANFHQHDAVLKENLQHLQRLLNRDPFILVLIDGNANAFNDRFVQDAAAGGKDAAEFLHDAVLQWAASSVTELPVDVKVVVRFFVDLKGVADAYVSAGVVASSLTFEAFAQGFTQTSDLIDIIDTGPANQTIISKMAKNFNLMVTDYHCRQILFGCSSDQRYLDLLEPYGTNGEFKPRVSFLEGLPLDAKLSALPFRTCKAPVLFRKNKLMIARVEARARQLNGGTQPFTPRTTTPYSPGTSPMGNGLDFDGVALPTRTTYLRQGSIGSSNSSDMAGVGGTWATMAKVNATKPVTELTPRAHTAPQPTIIRRNRKGQRLDEPLEYDKDEVIRLKKLKMCNQFYIGNGCCHFEAGKADKCPHRHDIKLNNQEKHFLRVVARETPCKRGTYCEDLKCIYGHRCPFPGVSEGSMRGANCINGENCRFPREMHNMDMVPVKTTKITGTF